MTLRDAYVTDVADFDFDRVGDRVIRFQQTRFLQSDSESVCRISDEEMFAKDIVVSH